MTRERQQKAVCPHCGYWDSKVMQGWADPRGYTRRRHCLRCDLPFRTREVTIDPAETKAEYNRTHARAPV